MLRNVLQFCATTKFAVLAPKKIFSQNSINLLSIPLIRKHSSASALNGTSEILTNQFKEQYIRRHISSVVTANENKLDKLYSRICIELRANDQAIMKSYSIFATAAAKHLNIEIGECYAQKKAHHERYTLLRSVHVVKRCRVQYEVRTYFRWMNFHKLTGSTCDTFLEYIERNLPEGVALKVTKYELQKIPGHLVPPSKLQNESSEQISLEAN